MVSNTIKIIYDNEIVQIKNPDPNQTILSYIRTELKKTGTKEGCSEGGCGACTIVLGELDNNEIKYSSINSCISFVPSLSGKQLLIVENLVSKNGKVLDIWFCEGINGSSNPGLYRGCAAVRACLGSKIRWLQRPIKTTF